MEFDRIPTRIHAMSFRKTKFPINHKKFNPIGQIKLDNEDVKRKTTSNIFEKKNDLNSQMSFIELEILKHNLTSPYSKQMTIILLSSCECRDMAQT